MTYALRFSGFQIILLHSDKRCTKYIHTKRKDFRPNGFLPKYIQFIEKQNSKFSLKILGEGGGGGKGIRSAEFSRGG